MNKELYKEAFLKQLVNKVNNSYVMDAVRAARPQNIAATTEESMSLHGMALGMLKQHGAVGADTISKVVNKGRQYIGDVDTGLGALAIGKKNMADPTKGGFRKNLFTFRTDNLKSVPKQGPKQAPGKEVFNDPNNLHVYEQQSRPSISAPLHSISRMAVPTLAMMKGQEVIEGFNNRNKEVNHAGDFN